MSPCAGVGQTGLTVCCPCAWNRMSDRTQRMIVSPNAMLLTNFGVLSRDTVHASFMDMQYFPATWLSQVRTYDE